MKNKEKISVNKDPSPLNNNPFDSLDLSSINLPQNKAPTTSISQSITSIPSKKGRIDLLREKSGRGGKVVTLISGITNPEDRKDLLKKLQKQCGCGGTLKNDIIEIQGDKRDEIAKALTDEGYRVVLAGG